MSVMKFCKIEEGLEESVQAIDLARSRFLGQQLKARMIRDQERSVMRYEPVVNEALEGLFDGGFVEDEAADLTDLAFELGWGQMIALPFTTKDNWLLHLTAGTVPHVRRLHRLVGKTTPQEPARQVLHLLRQWRDHLGGYAPMLECIAAGNAAGHALGSVVGIAPAVVQEAADRDPAFSDSAVIVGKLAIEVALSDAMRGHPREHAFSVGAFRWSKQTFEQRVDAGDTPFSSRDKVDNTAERASATYADTPRGRATRTKHDVLVAEWRGEREVADELRAHATRTLSEAGLTAGLERTRVRESLQ